MDDKSNAPQEKTVTAYKGFDMNFRCRDFQFEIGRTYQHEGAVEACVSGFHACEYPLDVFRYYHPATSRFAIVTQSGQLSRHHNDSKVASSVMRVESEIGLSELIQAAVAYVAGRCVPCDEQGAASATGYHGVASATGYMGAASATGYMGAASATGGNGVACSLGYQGVARAGVGGAICLCHRLDDGTLTHIRASKVGENGIKPDTWYRLSATGEFVEVGHASNAP